MMMFTTNYVAAAVLQQLAASGLVAVDVAAHEDGRPPGADLGDPDVAAVHRLPDCREGRASGRNRAQDGKMRMGSLLSHR